MSDWHLIELVDYARKTGKMFAGRLVSSDSEAGKRHALWGERMRQIERV